MQTYCMKWNYSTNEAEAFLYKSIPHKDLNWHCTIGFLIDTAPKNVYFILQYHLFFRKEFFFVNSLNTIFECSYLFFWLRNRSSIKYVRKWGNEGESSKICTGVYRGRAVFPSWFFLKVSILFYLWEFNLIFIQKGCVCQNGHFSPMKSISVVMKIFLL